MFGAIVGIITGLIRGAPRAQGTIGYNFNRAAGVASLAGMAWAGWEWYYHHQAMTFTITLPTLILAFAGWGGLVVFMEAQRRGPGDR